jgi:caffeoyl-CoA O-methyltransferase
VAKRFFAKSPHGKKISVRFGAALESLRDIRGPFDLAFIDADKENYAAYYEDIVPKVRPGGLLVADNTLWHGRVLAPQERSDHAIVEFNAKVSGDPRVEKVLLPVRDGVTLIWRRP